MKIVVLNGSPKGDTSVTLQYIHYLRRHFDHIHFQVINIAHRMYKIEKDNTYFQNIIEDISTCDGIIWAFPLYVFTAHSNYHRFIELTFERKVTSAFKDKYAAVLTTSIHFFDHTAVNYLNSICDDLDMNYYDYFSLSMYDLHNKKIRQNLLHFATQYLKSIDEKVPTLKNFNSISYSPLAYEPSFSTQKNNTSSQKLVIVTDSLVNNNLASMVKQLVNFFTDPIEIINLSDLDIKGSCLGCLKCAYDYNCVYAGKDDLIDIYKKPLASADIIVFAGSIGHRYLSSIWKQFFDRGFFNNHSPCFEDKQIGFLIAGPLNQVPNLRQILEAYAQHQRAHLVGFMTDEYSTSQEIDERLDAFATKLITSSTLNYAKPSTFLGVGGMKIFRDAIWGNLRFPFVADYKAYKKLKVFDFPQKNLKARFVNALLIMLSKSPIFRKQIYSNRIKTSMIHTLRKVVESSK